MAVHAGFIGLLAYWTFLLISPFLPIIVWSVVLTVALYPAYEMLAAALGGRRKTAAALITIIGLLVVIGPVAWLGVGLVDALRALIVRLETGKLVAPPSPAIKDLPLVGKQLYDYWMLAATNATDALSRLLPELQPAGQYLLNTVGNAGMWMLTFLISVIIAGFLFAPGPRLVAATKKLALRVDSARGEEFVAIAGATIRAISRGVIGISLLQSVVGSIGMAFAGVPAANLLALAILVFGIIQVGSLIVVAPLLVWGWLTMPTPTAVILTVFMAAVLVMESILKPFVMARGLTTPALVTLIGVLGGVLAYGLTGLFVGPVILAVGWDLANAWIHDTVPADTAEERAVHSPEKSSPDLPGGARPINAIGRKRNGVP
ncbi:MAG: AI-2E family transporter [Methylocapsa sp.]|nr:AI-2E family transporter [Methylocapsa sp.]